MRQRISFRIAVALARVFAVLASGCAVTDGGYGYGYDGGVAIGVDYNDPFGVDYEGWGPGYRVAPYRGGDHRGDRDGDRGRGGVSQRPHAFRPAPASHAMPSIPSHSRGANGGSRRR
jgi:hypothetical protein